MDNLRALQLSQAIICAFGLGASSQALPQDVDLGNLGSGGFRVDGIHAFDYSGISVSGAGDVNGDGLADLIIGANGADPGGDSYAGESYVVFGKADANPVDLATLGTGGFRIDGIDANDSSGGSVSGAGDVNGDGLADLIIGANGADPGGDNNAGESYVVFGKTDGTTVNLAALGTGGFRIHGIEASDFSGRSVSGAGDVNGDGLADLIVGAPRADPLGNGAVGVSYVVFGKADSTAVDLAVLGSAGFSLVGIDSGDFSGYSVSGAGDVNGDGLADLIIGALGADPNFENSAGEAYVVFGKADSTTVELLFLGAGGFLIEGIDESDSLGGSVSSTGDVNGDGLADLIVGARGGDAGGDANAGESYVVFGKADAAVVDLATLGSGGFRINGINAGDYSGINVSGAGDVNGDGLADVIVGAYKADPGGNIDAGEGYVVFGKASSAPVELNALGAGGYRLLGTAGSDQTGRSVSGAGDVNGDGLADLIVGASGATGSTGKSLVVFSNSTPPLSISVGARSANGNAPRIAFGISGDGSNDSTPDARAWVDFADGNDPAALASIETVTLNRSAGAFPSPRATVHWRLQTNRQDWTAAELKLKYLDSELTDGESGLQLQFSPNGAAPFTPLPSTTNRRNNTISATITQAGYYFIGTDPDLIFANGFD